MSFYIYIYIYIYIYFIIYLAVPDLSCSTCGLVPWPGIEPGPPALGVQCSTGPPGKSVGNVLRNWIVGENTGVNSSNVQSRGQALKRTQICCLLDVSTTFTCWKAVIPTAGYRSRGSMEGPSKIPLALRSKAKLFWPVWQLFHLDCRGERYFTLQ